MAILRHHSRPRRASSTLALVSVYRLPKLAPQILYQLLQEREPHVNISHQAMPTWKRHCNFIAGRPYAAWYLIRTGNGYVGAIYLTRTNEIAVAILRHWRGLGYAQRAVRLLMRQHGRRRYLANVNPQNEEWIRMFRRLGFGLIQHTYELQAGKRPS